MRRIPPISGSWAGARWRCWIAATTPKGAFSPRSPCGLPRVRIQRRRTAHRRQLRQPRRPGRCKWDGALRATAAHSTVTRRRHVHGGDPAARTGTRSSWGRGCSGGPLAVETSRQETPAGWRVDGGHDGYVRAFGIEHERALTLGADRAIADRRRHADAARKLRREARFHLRCVSTSIPTCAAPSRRAATCCSSCRPARAGASTPCGPVAHRGKHLSRRRRRQAHRTDRHLPARVQDQPVSLAWAFEQIEHALEPCGRLAFARLTFARQAARLICSIQRDFPRERWSSSLCPRTVRSRRARPGPRRSPPTAKSPSGPRTSKSIVTIRTKTPIRAWTSTASISTAAGRWFWTRSSRSRTRSIRR